MNVAALAGTIVGSLVLPVAGLILLIVGIRKRSTSRRQASIGYPPGYPPATGYPGAQPGYPPPPGYPPAAGYPMPPQPVPPKPAGTGLIVTGIVLLVVGALAVVGTLANAVLHSSRLAIGDCLTNSILTDPPDWHPSSCSNSDAVLQYAANADSNGNCPDGKRNDSSYLSAEHNGVRMCFAANLLQGQCYASEHNDKTVRAASCSRTGTVRVVKRIDGSTDASACPKHTRALTYPQPKRTYCTERAGTS
ncbi:LppU/SCO3897 family protein [Mycobacterium attenuatum]|uniref:LppU/SCO3897 family protein n=1 Tax=Mycobacterium attenuatum TaxID=2341086 RepID=UPI000F01D3FC|nr:hypothetical protein [Mycobacterium attenuatum]VBA49286.1 hypothetical protein LAUMK191_01530 [Mycobacterium attenuatum]VBA54898.1 hypothetical protein LAUMK41_01602 [Mycobacterium attenuatum]